MAVEETEEGRCKRGLFITAHFKYHDLKTGPLAESQPLPPSSPLYPFALDARNNERAHDDGVPRGIIIINGYVLRLSVAEKLLNSEGRELRRALFSLKQIFQVGLQFVTR